MQDIITEAMVCLSKLRDIIEGNPSDGEKLGLNHFTDEPEVISEIIAELYHANRILR